MKQLAKKVLRYFALKSHSVQVQLLLATLYGLIELFGVAGAFAIILKARKLAKKKPSNRVTAKPAIVTKGENLGN